MIEVEGYKAFKGTMKIVPKGGYIQPFEVQGQWLYKPQYKCWYCDNSSYPEEICVIVKDLTV